MAATLCILVLMVVAASCLYEAFVYMAVKQKSTFVGRKTKEKVLAMSRKTRQGKAVLFIVLAVVCFVLMVVPDTTCDVGPAHIHDGWDGSVSTGFLPPIFRLFKRGGNVRRR